MTSTDKDAVLNRRTELKGLPPDHLLARLFDSGKAFCVGWTEVTEIRSAELLLTMARGTPADTTRNHDRESKSNQPKGRLCRELSPAEPHQVRYR